MNQKYFSIGKTAEIMKVTVKALRFYDKIGLLKPEHINPVTKYRYYCADQFVYIDIIKAARDLGISPNALVPHFAEKDTNMLMELMQNHKNTLIEKICGLKKTIDRVETLEKALKAAEHTDKSGAIYIKDLPDRYAITRPMDMKQLQDNMSIDFYLLNASLSQAGLPCAYEDGIIYSLDKDTLKPECIYACVLADKRLKDYRLLPGGKYICTVFQKQNAEEQYTKLLEYVTDHKLEMRFIVQTELLTDFFVGMPEYFEAQVKVVSE